MIKIKESNQRYPFYMEQTLSRYDNEMKQGIALLKEQDIEFVHEGKADFGISWHGEPVVEVSMDKTILYRAEPPIYNIYFGRKLNKPSFLKQYLAVLSDYVLDDFPVVHFNIPMEFDFIEKYFNREKAYFICMILKNKSNGILLNSLFPSLKKYKKYSNMEMRREFDDICCSQLGPDSYDSYGRGWNKKCFHGELPRWGNLDVMANHKFTIAIENCSLPGYVTEKMLWTMFCGSIPIYYGAPDVEKYVPKKAFIDCREFANISEVIDYILGISDEERIKYVANIQKYLSSKASKQFSSMTLAEKIIDIIGGKINVENQKNQ